MQSGWQQHWLAHVLGKAQFSLRNGDDRAISVFNGRLLDRERLTDLPQKGIPNVVNARSGK